ncbi:MAG TPA: cupin domain-containing protein [Archaeoglobaceae archaeon]|nr:cupin domain-containing protein [Archaeoglobaceae archaeon]
MKFEEGKWEDRGSYRVMKVFEISEDSFVQIVEIKPDSEVKKHYHRKQTEVFSILSGRAILGIGNSEWEAKEGDIYLCRPGSTHWVVNRGDKPFKLFVFKYGWEKDDIVWVE